LSSGIGVPGSSERSSEIASLAPGVIHVFDVAERRSVYLDQATASALGYDRDELVAPGSRMLAELLHPEDAVRLAEHIDRLSGLQDGAVAEVEYRVRHRDGSWRWFLSRDAVHSRDAEGRPREVLHMATDISGRKDAEGRLRASEALYGHLFEHNPQPMWFYDTTTLQFLAVNDAAVELYGYGREEFMRMTMADIQPLEDVQGPRDAVTAAQPSRRPTHAGAWRHRTRDGSVIDVELISHDLALDGRSARLALVHDITQRNRAAEALRVSEERYRMLLGSIDQGFCVLEILTDAEGAPSDYRFVEVNPVFEQHTGLRDAVGRTARELVPDLERHWVEAYARVAATGEPARFEQASVAMGRVFEVEAVRVGRPEERKVALLFRDVTERRQTDRALSDAQARLRSALEAGSVGTWSWEVGPDRVVADERMAHLFGVPVEDAAAGRSRATFAAAIHPDDRSRADSEIARVVESGDRYETEYRVRSPGGLRWVQVRGQVHRDAQGRPERLIGATVDITPLKDAEADLREREARLGSALRVKDEFLGLVSHELRTPMTVILGMSRILARADVEASRLREMATDVAESAEILNELVEGMLLLARLDRGEATQLREPVLIDRVAEEVVDRARMRDRSRVYSLQIHDRTAIVDVQRTWLERVIENLVSNAGKYGMPGTTVTVLLDRDARSARLRVLDVGPGMSEDEVESVFQPFYRSARAHQSAPGVGLGLAVAKRIVALLGGRIWARPRPGGGSEFGFELPIVDEPG
jgi:PAS domain S-box-containing protein